MSLAAPFILPEREPVTQVRGRSTAELRALEGLRTQDMGGFEPHWRDITDYIVGITEEIWTDRKVDRIRATYAADCAVTTSFGTARGVEGVIAGTVQGLYAFPDGEIQHHNVAWSGDARDFYTSHLGFSRSTNLGPTAYGPPTGAKMAVRFVADCISRDNLIHTEWLARDNGAAVRQLGLTPGAAAAVLAKMPASEPLIPLAPDAPGLPEAGDLATAPGWMAHHFATVWNARAFGGITQHYTSDAVAHWPSERDARGPRAIADLLIGLLASVPDGLARVEHISWSEESDGPIVAVRWRLDGSSSPFGSLGAMPAGRPISLIGMSHFRFAGGLIVEEWTVFDEVAALVQALRG